MRQNPSTNDFSRRVRGKKIKKEEALCFTHFARRSLMAQFGLRVRLVDVINCAKFYRNRLRGLDSVRGRNLTIPIGLRCRH